ncbi:MAG TPA: endonuclease MutS2 [Anaerolineales bacterium]|nr:endonuclease MutS2 [Anaerolineales bacterium]
MDLKTLQTLEYPKILARLAGYCAFAVSKENAHNLQPSHDIEEIKQRQAITHEAFELLITRPDLTIGGARDIRSIVDLAQHGGVLIPPDLLDIKSTLLSARSLTRIFDRLGAECPHLTAIAIQIAFPNSLIDDISGAISERGEILDSASEKLNTIRREMRISHDRLLTKMQRMVSDPKNGPYLQEALVTQRDGRYVLPLRAEFKGRIKSIVHDQSASGATLFVEPLAVVELNNQYREMQLAERDEERRILADLSDRISKHAQAILDTLDAIARLDLAFACAKYADDLNASEPDLLPIAPPKEKEGNKTTPHPGTTIRLYQARHPLLDEHTVVPVDVELDDQTYALVITGPNTGGKTVTLKTVGLLALMAQAGLHIPVQAGSKLSVFREIYADIGDEQSIEQSLSTFSGHITNIIHILKKANQNSLVILDELGAGTDPQEGAALARALLTHLLQRGITTLVTTHHPELKAYAHSTPGVVNASVEFNLETLQPTYHLTIGLPGRSNALAIAQRLGMPAEIIAAARSELSPTDLRAEDLLDEIHRQRDLSRQARAAAEKTHQQAETLRAELAERLDKIEEERRQVLEKTRSELENETQKLHSEIRDLRRDLVHARQPLEALQHIQTRLDAIEQEVDRPVERRQPKLDGLPLRRAVRLGDRVRLRSLNTKGIITSMGEEEAEIQVGVLRIRTRIAELELVEGQEQEPVPDLASSERPAATFNLPSSPGIELDLRGRRAEEAVEALDQYLDSAYLAGLPFVRIIHGKGTGKLREVVRKSLSANPHVQSFESGGDKEGGEGVTVATLRN